MLVPTPHLLLLRGEMLMVVQAACRAIIVDTLPAQKQEIGNAWASRMVAGGHLIGYTMYPSHPTAALESSR